MSEISEPQRSQTSGVSERPQPQQPTMPEALEEIEDIDAQNPLRGVTMGSKNDMEKMEPAEKALKEAGILCEVRVMSAHRDPELVTEYCTNAKMRGLKGIIAGAGVSAGR